MRALLIFLFPALELYLLVRAGSVLGALGVVAEVFASAALGILVLRFQGRHSFFKVQEEIRAGHMPEDILLDNLLVFFAGILLIFPGLISDTLGLLLLIPPLRPFFRRFILSRLAAGDSNSFRSGSVFVYRSDTASGVRPEEREEGEIIDVTLEPESLKDDPEESNDATGKGGSR